MAKIDLTGQRFGLLTAIRPTDEKYGGSCVLWECRCDCGNTVLVPTSRLTSENTKSCGCLYRKNLTGRRFGMLVAIRPTEKRLNGQIAWECKCDCGNTAYVRSNCLTSGKTKSCGCNRYFAGIKTKEQKNASR